MIKSLSIRTACVIAAIATTSCSREPPSAQGADAPTTSAEAESPAEPLAALPSMPRVDPFGENELKAGLNAMMPRIITTVDGYSAVVPRPDARFNLHPGEERNAIIEFDVSDLSTVTLSPLMGDFSSSADCMGTPEAGVARLRWSLDGGEPTAIMVDRAYSGSARIETLGANRLRIEVDKGNDQTWCDWVGLGVVKVQ